MHKTALCYFPFNSRVVIIITELSESRIKTDASGVNVNGLVGLIT